MRIDPANDWGSWGTFTLGQFERLFGSSKQWMQNQMDICYDYHIGIRELIQPSPHTFDSLTPALPSALFQFATDHVPHRVEDLHGNSVVYAPHRDNRPGARPSVPKLGPDVFRGIMEGSETDGYAVVVHFDQDGEVDPDDLLTRDVRSRSLAKADAHAVTIVNKFQTYVRTMDPELYCLLERIGFVSHSKYKNGIQDLLRTIPFGFNLVSFPFVYADSVSRMPIFDLYSTLRSAQRSVQRCQKLTESDSLPYSVFMNIKELAGGTQPRIHIQSWLRTKMDPLETYSFNLDGSSSMKGLAEGASATLGCGNRNWQAFVPLVRSSRYDIRFELRHERERPFVNLTEDQLWDLSEMLIYYCNVLDSVIGFEDRNIQVLPTGIVIGPFTVTGGHEKNFREKAFGRSAESFARLCDAANIRIDRPLLYRSPVDSRGLRRFRRLVDQGSAVFARSV